METIAIRHPSPLSSGDKRVLAGRILSGLVITFLLFDAAIKLLALPVVTDTMATLGWPADVGTARLLGVLTLFGTLLYTLPRTALIGAIFLTAYLGGAVATHARIGSPLVTHTLFGVYLGTALWLGLLLRLPRLRALIEKVA